MKHLCILLIKFYRKVLSPLKGKPCCRFVPSCSAYAIEALQKRGLFCGTILAVGRILRCQPFGRAGWDPVPEYGLRAPRYPTKPMSKYFYPEEYGLGQKQSQDGTQGHD